MPARQVLKNFQLFVDGRGFAGEVEEVNLPKLTVQTEDWRAGGMDTTLPLDMGMEKLEMSFMLIGFNRDILNLFGLIPTQDVAFTLRGALENLDGTVEPMVVACRGRFREFDPGTSKAGDKPALTMTVDLLFYAMTISGAPVITIDTLNMIRQIGGIDRLAQQRAAIGL